MSAERQPFSALDAYEEIIDQLVTETSHGISERLVAETGIFSKAPERQKFNLFVQSLSTEQRGTLAEMLHAERTSAIHDVLAVFTWWATARDLAFTYRSEPMPIGFEGGLHLDYVGRLNDWQWPKNPLGR